MKTPRCGRPDNEIEGNGFAYYTPKWRKHDLTYYFASYTNDIEREDLLEATAKAFKFWSDVTPLTFRRDTEGVRKKHLFLLHDIVTHIFIYLQ